MEEAATDLANNGTSGLEQAAFLVFYVVYAALLVVAIVIARRADVVVGRVTAAIIFAAAVAAIVVGVLAQVDNIEGTINDVNLGPPLLGSGLIILAVIFWVWMLLDCATLESDGGNDKVTWTIIILAMPFLGPVLYYLVRRPQRRSEIGR